MIINSKTYENMIYFEWFDMQMIYNIVFSKNMTLYDLVPNNVYMTHMLYPISIHCYYQYSKTSMVYENKKNLFIETFISHDK